jgi:hypothetical protein
VEQQIQELTRSLDWSTLRTIENTAKQMLTVVEKITKIREEAAAQAEGRLAEGGR